MDAVKTDAAAFDLTWMPISLDSVSDVINGQSPAKTIQ